MTKKKYIGKTYTIDQIRYFLNGCCFAQRDENQNRFTPITYKNTAIKYAIDMLENDEDGIEAVWERQLFLQFLGIVKKEKQPKPEPLN